MARLQKLMGTVNAAGAGEKDAAAYIEFLDAQPQVNTANKVGTQGYCMGGALGMRTAAAVPDRVGAGASFHGGGLVTDSSRQPAYAGAPDQGASLHRHRVERRQPSARGERQAAAGIRRRQGAG
jgi:dienelactone hydrolase